MFDTNRSQRNVPVHIRQGGGGAVIDKCCSLLVHEAGPKRHDFHRYFQQKSKSHWFKKLFQVVRFSEIHSFGVRRYVAVTLQRQYQKFETNIPRKGIAGHSPNFHNHVYVSDLYLPTIDLPIHYRKICGRILGIYK
jgi:hypothetical protein